MSAEPRSAEPNRRYFRLFERQRGLATLVDVHPIGNRAPGQRRSERRRRDPDFWRAFMNKVLSDMATQLATAAEQATLSR